MWYTISAYNVLPHELLDLLGHDGGLRLGLDLFGKIINDYYEEFYLPLAG